MRDKFEVGVASVPETEVRLEYVNDDWEELYINGKLVDQDHSLSSYEIVERLCTAFGIPYNITYREG